MIESIKNEFDILSTGFTEIKLFYLSLNSIFEKRFGPPNLLQNI